MEELFNNVEESVRERLLTAGIREVEQHGFNDFSLRRVASACNLSCAAPYRHFKSKEHLIIEIFKYINSRWQMLADEVVKAFAGDDKRCMTELCVAYLRFLTANTSYLSMLFQQEQLTGDCHAEQLPKPDEFLSRLIAQQDGLTDEEREMKVFAIRSAIYGTAMLIRNADDSEKGKLVEQFRKLIVNGLI